MTNPNDAVGTNAAYDGRTSVNAFNDDLAAYTSGILSGWACTPNSGLTVSLGGDGSTRDVAVAEDNAGNKTSINNISGSPIDVTMSAAPGSNSRIDLIVAYVDNPPQGVNTTADNPSACGIINVTGTASSTPVAPNDTAIRTAITGDGASGATAYYAILAVITIPSGTTDITTSNIQAGPSAKLDSNNIDFTNSNQYEELGRVTLATNKIPNEVVTLSKTCKYIKFIFSGSSATAGASLQIRFNNDTGANYPRVVMQRTVSTSTTDWFADNATSINVGGGPDANTPARVYTEVSKTPNGWMGWTVSSMVNFARWGAQGWSSTNDITSVSVASSGNHTWKAGSTLVVYGHN